MDLGLTGQAALVTGAGRGIGAAIARRLSAEGCAVALVDLGAMVEAEALAATLRSDGARAIALEADVTSPAAAERAVATAVAAFGRLDLLVCNAGIARDRVVWRMTEEEWDAVLDVNLKGCWTFCRAAAPVFRSRQAGRIVMVSSINALRGKAGLSNYSAAKAGILGLARTLARELGPSGVTVNCVAPGMVHTDLTARLPAEIMETARAEAALGRLSTPDDVANAVAFLGSAAARQITGEVLRVDGGQYL